MSDAAPILEYTPYVDGIKFTRRRKKTKRHNQTFERDDHDNQHTSTFIYFSLLHSINIYLNLFRIDVRTVKSATSFQLFFLSRFYQT